MYRTGAAARLAGLPVETLRVWERRYGLSDAQRSERGQRLYSAEQVARLSLLKQLVDQGHAIGVLAGLTREQLQSMLGLSGQAQTQSAAPVRAIMISNTLTRRLAAMGREATGIDVRAHCASLEQLDELPPDSSADVLIIEMSELDDGVLPRVAAARERVEVGAVVVLYRFCPSATIRALRAQGCLVARVPADLSELAVLCRSALSGQRLPLPEPEAPVLPRRFDEDTLVTIANASDRLVCECPRHLSDLLMMIGSFERYSLQCASRNPDDAELHALLGRASGQARVLLEDAMERLAIAEGLPLPGRRT
jgi:DNA-binding transcriptional MerR regulator